MRNIELSKGDGYEIVPFDPPLSGPSLNPCPMGKNYYFKVLLDSDYMVNVNFRVLANGTICTPDGASIYCVRAGSTDIIITVEGVEQKAFEDKIVLTTDVNDSVLTVYAEMTSNVAANGMLGVYALYDGRGKLLAVQTENVDVEYGTSYSSMDFDLSEFSDKKFTVKYFVLRNERIKPFLPCGMTEVETE